MEFFDLDDLDRHINNQEDAVAVAMSIIRHFNVNIPELIDLVRNGVIGPNLARARKVADKSKQLQHYAKIVSNNTGGRSFQDLLATGEGGLLLLCMDVAIGKSTNEFDDSWETFMPVKPKKQHDTEKKWWHFWRET